MPSHYVKSADGRTIWTVNLGKLTEQGPYIETFTLNAVDTQILKNLLCASSDEIDEAAEKALIATGVEIFAEDDYATGVEDDE